MVATSRSSSIAGFGKRKGRRKERRGWKRKGGVGGKGKDSNPLTCLAIYGATAMH